MKAQSSRKTCQHDLQAIDRRIMTEAFISEPTILSSLEINRTDLIPGLCWKTSPHECDS